MTLLAKSAPPGKQPRTLAEHTLDVVEAAETLFGSAKCPTRLGREWLRFFRLERTDWPRFHANLLAACLFHDWGKANEGMQRILRTGSGTQLFRHEHLSVLMLGHEGVSRWAERRQDIDWSVVLAAVGSHHLKFGDKEFAEDSGANDAVQVLVDHEEFRYKLVPLTAGRLGLSGDPKFPLPRYWGFDNSDETMFDVSALRDELKRKKLRELDDQGAKRVLNAVRAALIVADAAGSGLPRTDRSVMGWIQGQFDRAPLCDLAAVNGVVDGRIEQLTEQGRWKNWSAFQDDCATLPDRALLLAPCGSGKTLAAWRWIAGRVGERPVQRVLFLYPTRATATEGFKDYVSWAPEAAALVHGTAGYDLDGMFAAEDPRRGKSFAAVDPRLYSLQHWSKRIFSATVDQFLGFMSYGYGPMCLLPILADSVIVVDEVHSFDRSMFSALLKFLETFDVPVLCMTATLPKIRREQLAPLVGRVYGPTDYPTDLAETADVPRYTVTRTAAEDVMQLVRDAVRDGKRVLWVVNQVSRAQAAVKALEGTLPASVPLICYHSRFKLNDRVKRHQDTVGAIRAGQPAAVAVTTQVCEMSLDIDADLLITEACPITSLIQRMGRCNRQRDPRPLDGSGRVLVYHPEKESVYSKDDLAGLDRFIAALAGKASVNQTDLVTVP